VRRKHLTITVEHQVCPSLMAMNVSSERLFSKVLLSMWENSPDRQASRAARGKLRRANSQPFRPAPPLCSARNKPSLRKMRSSISKGPLLEEDMAGALPNVRHCRSLVDQVELRRAIFHEGRAQLRQQRCHSCPLDRFKLAAHAVLRGTHVVLLQNEVVTIWTEASGHGKKQLEDTFQDSGMEPASMTNDVDTLQKPGDVDTMLAEFEIMSSHLPGLKDSKDFQKDAQRLTSMVHSSISTLLNMHDSASAGLDDLSALRMQFTEQVTRAQELWNSIKDDVIRIQILLGQCSEPSVTQQPPKVRPPAFIKIVEHSLESLGAFKDVCAKRSAPKDDCMNSSSNQDAELFAALGGGTYQRLVDWGDHWDTL